MLRYNNDMLSKDLQKRLLLNVRSQFHPVNDKWYFQVLYTRYKIPIPRNSSMVSSMDRNVYRIYSAKVNYLYEDWTWSCKKGKTKSENGTFTFNII